MFGRLKEQPPPQSLVGGASSATPPADDQPSGGPPEGLILLVFAILTVAASAFVLTRADDRALHDPVQKAARGEITGLDSLSFLRAANLRRALAKVSGGPRPLVLSVRVSATRVDVGARDRDGSRKFLSIDPGLHVKQSDNGVGDDPAVPVSRIDAAAPERMVRAVAERTRLGAGAVDYVVLTIDASPERNWFMSLDKGPARVRQWVAAADGSDLRKPGEPSQAQRTADARRRRDLERHQRRLARRSACLGHAPDATSIERCFRRYPP